MSGDRSRVTRGTHARRCGFFAAVLILAAAACVVRAGQLQLVERERWRQKALAQSEPRVEIPASRGGMYDRAGRPLALDGHEYRAYLAPREVTDRSAAVSTIGRILGLTRAQVAALRGAAAGWVAIPRRVSDLERDRLVQALGRAVHFDRLGSRVYPEGGLARALLGSVGPDGSGLSGLELVLDDLLTGRPGAAIQRRDARGATYRLPGALLTEPEPGHDVYLTIDAELQAIAEDALDRAIRQTGASGGDVVLADPRTGELLAVASRGSDGGRRIPAFTDPFEPGSTAKPFLLAALLAEGAASLTDRVYAEHGEWRDGSRTIRDVHPYDTLSVAEVIRFSSNIGAAKLAKRLEPGQQYRYLRDFGFGTPTGVEYPSESGGLLRRPENWSGLSQASLAFGYEFMVTSLQLVAAYAALANGGVLMQPGLVREVRAADGSVVWRRQREPIRRIISRELADTISRVLGSVVAEGGTGREAALATLPVAGKTGTARIASIGGYGERRYAASFVGYAPVDDPRLVVLTKLEDPQGRYYGGQTAAPISRSVVQAAMATRGIALRGAEDAPTEGWRWNRTANAGHFFLVAAGPQPPRTAVPRPRWEGGALGPPREDADAFPVLPDLRGLSVRAAAARLHELGLSVELLASGHVREQRPAPGTRMRAGETITLR
ncbi:MAG: penicillin-binding protein [Gemmatimonadota bacterium]